MTILTDGATANDSNFFERLNAVVQYEPIESLDPQTRGLFASVGIITDEPPKPDARMKKLLAEAIGNATARAITSSPRNPGNYTCGEDSGGLMAYSDRNTTFTDNGAYDIFVATLFYYNAIGVAPAMALTSPGVGPDYGLLGADSEKRALFSRKPAA